MLDTQKLFSVVVYLDLSKFTSIFTYIMIDGQEMIELPTFFRRPSTCHTMFYETVVQNTFRSNLEIDAIQTKLF